MDRIKLQTLLMMPPPIPEPPRVINSRPLLSDSSLDTTSDCLHTNIHPITETLQQLRRKYGIVSNNDQFSSNVSSVVDRRKKVISESNAQQSSSHNIIRKRLKQIQTNLKEQMEKLQQSNDDSPVKQQVDTEIPSVQCQCSRLQANQQLVPFDQKHSSTELIEYIKRQDEQLKHISQQIEELKVMHQKNKQIDTTANTSDLISFNRQQQLEVSATSNGKYKVEKRSIQTMTSMIADKMPPKFVQCKVPVTSTKINDIVLDTHHNLDSSIEKIRRDMKKVSVQNKNIMVQDQSNFTPDSDQLYDNIMANINSILVRNGSFESTENDLFCSSSSSSTHSAGRRSSCSNTSESNVCWDSHTNCVQRNNDKQRCKHDPIRNSNRKKIYLKSKPEPTRDYHEQLNSEFNQLYALSEHDTSFATRNYLDKYGLKCVTKSKIGDNRKQVNRAKTTAIEPLIEVDENSDDQNYGPGMSKSCKPNGAHRSKNIKEIKSRPQDFDRILDLDAIRSLPKFT